jgi:phosphoglycolate/pyridoxal phosphate phosphatase family enzyme
VLLADAYDAFILDLDGVLFRGDEPIAAATPTVDALRAAGKRLVFLTNNSARTPDQIASKLGRLGIDAAVDEVVTSAQATADLLAAESGDGTPSAYVIGQDGVRSALADAGFHLVDGDVDRSDFVVVGWDGDVTYDALRRATVLVRGGARLVATNADASYPAPGGEQWPGAGAILAAVETASGVSATVVGKPHRPLFEAALARAGTRNALMVGDRLETDVAGAAAAGLDAALVLSGVSRARDLLDGSALPVAVLPDIGGLLTREARAVGRPATAEEMDAVESLTETPDGAPSWGPEGVWVIADSSLDATATVEVRGGDAYLRAVATRRELRGSGLGTLAVAAAVGWARERGAARVWLLTETAEPFFGGLGFELVERDMLPGWIEAGPADGCPATAVAMRRELAQ